MVLYEVNLTVDSNIASAYSEWLDGHIQNILKIDGFLGADWLTLMAQEGDDLTKIRWTILYRLRDQAALDAYFVHHAPAFRADGMQRFGGRFTATRRVLLLQRKYYSGTNF